MAGEARLPVQPCELGNRGSPDLVAGQHRNGELLGRERRIAVEAGPDDGLLEHHPAADDRVARGAVVEGGQAALGGTAELTGQAGADVVERVLGSGLGDDGSCCPAPAT